MSNPMIRIHNLETDEVIDRKMTNEEYASYLNDLEPKALSTEEKAQLEAKAELLAKLGITEEEAKLLLK